MKVIYNKVRHYLYLLWYKINPSGLKRYCDKSNKYIDTPRNRWYKFPEPDFNDPEKWEVRN